MMRRCALWAWGRRPDSFALLIAGIALAGAALVLARQSAYGPGLTSDSLRFISEARILLDGERFIGGRMVATFYWPPLYPLALAIGGMGLIDPLSVAGPLNAAIFGLTVFVVGEYLRRRLASRLMAAWACAMVALSVPLARDAAWALTDTLFVLLLTLALVRADDYLRDGKTSALAWTAIFGALAWQTRYTGIIAPAVISLALLLQQGTPLTHRAGRVALVALAAALPMALWLQHNHTGGAGLSIADVDPDPAATATLLGFVTNSMREWVVPVLRYEGWGFLETLPLGGAAPASAALVVGLTAAIAVLTTGAFSRAGRDSAGGQAPRAFGWRSCLLFGGFAAAHFAALIIIMSFERTLIEPDPTPIGSRLDEPRFVAPMYAPLLMTVAIALDALLIRAARWRAAGSAVARVGGQALAVALIAALAIWLAGAAALSLTDTARAAAGGYDMEYAMPRWTNSDTLRYLRENPVEGEIYSNNSLFLHHSSGGEGIYFGFRSINKDAESKSSLEKVARWVANTPDGTYVFWFANEWVNKGIDYGAGTMRITPGLQPVAELSDGAVFRVNKGYAPRENLYSAAYNAIAAGDYGEPAARANFQVYIADGAVAYLKEPCAAADAMQYEIFFLHIFPQDAANLPADRKEIGFVNADFKFADFGANLDGKCIAVAPLPDYPIERIRTGQYVAFGTTLWSAEVNANRDRYMAAYRAIAAGNYGEPAAQAAYALYRGDDSLIYAREPCAPEDTQARFFLHIFPQDAANLPAERGESGFVNADFAFAERGADLGGKCVAIAPLPAYPIERIRTGQHTRGEGQVWRAELE